MGFALQEGAADIFMIDNGNPLTLGVSQRPSLHHFIGILAGIVISVGGTGQTQQASAQTGIIHALDNL